MARKFIPPLIGEQLIHLVVRITGQSISSDFGAFLHAYLRERVDMRLLDQDEAEEDYMSLREQVREILDELSNHLLAMKEKI